MYFRGGRINKMKDKIYQALLAFTVIGLVFSPYLTSLSLIGLVILAAFHWRDFQRRQSFGLWFILLFFNILFLVGTDPVIPYWIGRLRVHLPFLLLPIAFLFLPTLSAKQQLNFHLFFAFVLLVGCAHSMVLYYGEIDIYQERIKMGQSIPGPTRSHIRFNMMLVYALLNLGWFGWNRPQLLNKKWKKVAVILSIILLFISIHWLSVRSGLLTLYSMLALIIIRHIWRSKLWKWGFGGLIFLIGMPVLSYFSLPSFKAKVGYTVYEFEMILKGQGEGYSNGDRIASMIDGWTIFRNHPIWGIGSGRLREGMKNIAKKEYASDLEVLIPHNQWIIEAAQGGIIGLVLFMFGFFMPLLGGKRAVSGSFYLIYCIVGISMLFEPTLETAEGIGLFLIGILIARKQ